MIWVEFILSSALIVMSGMYVTRFADALCERFSLSKVWIGILVLGFATSLPEAATSIAAVVSIGAINLAVGNMVGSNGYNLMIIVVLDVLFRRGSITSHVRARPSHIFAALFSVIAMVIVFGAIGLQRFVDLPRIGPVDISSIFIILVYVFGMRILSHADDDNIGMPTRKNKRSAKTSSAAYIVGGMIGSIVLVILSAVWLAHTAERIVMVTGLGETFVGTALIAIATSLPEITVSIAAFRIGSVDLALGNIFGSNMLNMFILAICDICYLKGSIYRDISFVHIIPCMMVITLTGLVLAGMRDNKKKVFFGLGIDTIAMTFCFVVGMSLLYYVR